MNVLLIRIVDAEGTALNAIRFSMLYKGPRVRAFYLAERVTRQLGQGDASMPLPPPSFMLFPYETLEMQLAVWRAISTLLRGWMLMVTLRSTSGPSCPYYARS